MVGSILVFIAAVIVIAVYMSVVHSFLKSAEEPGDFPAVSPKPQPVAQKEISATGRTQLAH